MTATSSAPPSRESRGGVLCRAGSSVLGGTSPVGAAASGAAAICQARRSRSCETSVGGATWSREVSTSDTPPRIRTPTANGTQAPDLAALKLPDELELLSEARLGTVSETLTALRSDVSPGVSPLSSAGGLTPTSRVGNLAVNADNLGLKPEADTCVSVRRGSFRDRRKVTIEMKIHKMLDLKQQTIEAGEMDAEASHSLDVVSHPTQELYSPGAVCSIWGRSTEKDVYQPYFSDKPINIDNFKSFSNLPHMLGVHCQRGQKPNSPNQDDFCVIARKDWLVFGVMDGHGPNGHKVSHFAQEHVPKCVLNRFLPKRGPKLDWAESVKGAFEEVADSLKSQMADVASASGTTCSLACLSPAAAEGGWCLRSAFVGDSAIVYGKKKPGEGWEVKQLGESHKPDREDELARIESVGGQVCPSPGPRLPSRLVIDSGGLAMSRALGDLDAHKHGLISEPEVPEEVTLEESCEHIILICSDGVWDVMEPAAAVQLVAKFAPDNCQTAAEKLAAKAQLRWQEQDDASNQIDDITVIVVRPGQGAGKATSA